MFDIIGKRLYFLLFSAALVLASVIVLVVSPPRPGIEFSSGSVMTVGFTESVEKAELAAELDSLGYTSAIIQTVGDGDFLIRLPELLPGVKADLQENLTAVLGELTVRDFTDVGPMVANETTRDATIAVSLAAIGILLYVAWAFRKMQHPFRYGSCAIIALVHDTVIAMGVFAVLGALLGWEMDLMFVTGILAVIGYSVNDTVVAFDRIRENVLKNEKFTFQSVVNNSLVDTIGRSLNTSVTTLFVILALVLFVGPAIYNFAVVMLVGIIVGTYSSIFIAPALLVVWQTRKWGKFSTGTPKLGEA